MMGAATEKARLPRFSLVLGIESFCEVDDLSWGPDRKAGSRQITMTFLGVGLMREHAPRGPSK